ncbi:hypothetical protein M9H77_23073 [Catharanthus roseus]|uniref:Uncharacterized protein n=1 Tax=Catharanthus roseus TaxID=4058 RepID=A0ACC0ATS6_CATRO|nr:hypothetical protein M9H77_23073 [Catharanthus roseus]
MNTNPKDWRYEGYDPFVLPYQAEQDLFLPYPESKRLRTDWASVMKSRTRLLDFPNQDDAFQENVDIHEDSAIDVMIEDVGPQVHYSRSLEELDIAIETYFEQVRWLENDLQTHTDQAISTKTQLAARSDAAASSSALTIQPSSSTAPPTDLATWKPPPSDTR